MSVESALKNCLMRSQHGVCKSPGNKSRKNWQRKLCILHCFYLDFFKVLLTRFYIPRLPVQKLLLMRVNFGICAKFNRQAGNEEENVKRGTESEQALNSTSGKIASRIL